MACTCFCAATYSDPVWASGHNAESFKIRGGSHGELRARLGERRNCALLRPDGVAGFRATCCCNRARLDFWLFAQCPSGDRIGLTMNNIFLVLLAPSNPQVYNPLTFYSECMFVAFALGVVFLASRLLWPVSAFDKQHAVVRATQKALTASVAGAEYSLPALEFSLASRIADYVASAAGARRPRREILKGLLSTNDLSFAVASAHLHLAQNSEDPAIRSRIGQLQRALWSGNSRRLRAGARSILRRMRVSQAEARAALLAAATDLWSAGLVLEREKRRIRHFCDHGSVRKGDVRWSLH